MLVNLGHKEDEAYEDFKRGVLSDDAYRRKKKKIRNDKMNFAKQEG